MFTRLLAEAMSSLNCSRLQVLFYNSVELEYMTAFDCANKPGKQMNPRKQKRNIESLGRVPAHYDRYCHKETRGPNNDSQRLKLGTLRKA